MLSRRCRTFDSFENKSIQSSFDEGSFTTVSFRATASSRTTGSESTMSSTASSLTIRSSRVTASATISPSFKGKGVAGRISPAGSSVRGASSTAATTPSGLSPIGSATGSLRMNTTSAMAAAAKATAAGIHGHQRFLAGAAFRAMPDQSASLTGCSNPSIRSCKRFAQFSFIVCLFLVFSKAWPWRGEVVTLMFLPLFPATPLSPCGCNPRTHTGSRPFCNRPEANGLLCE